MSARRDDQISTRPLLDRLGVRAGMRVSVLGDFTESFLALLRERVGEVADDPAGSDIVFLAAEDRTQLAGAAMVAANLRHDAALWIVRPRGSSAITEGESRAAGLAAGLVDVKVVHFSDTHTAFKFVFRVRDR